MNEAGSLRAQIRLRPGREDDAPLIISTWVNSYRYGNAEAKRILRKVYFEWQRALVIDILRRPTTAVLVAHDPEMDTVIYGYLVGEVNRAERPIVHYLYVKEPWQHLGIATALLEATGWDLNRLFYTHYTRDRLDPNPGSPTYGKVRWRGTETLLRKWPAAAETAESTDQRSQRGRTVVFRDGNMYNPHLAFLLVRPQ